MDDEYTIGKCAICGAANGYDDEYWGDDDLETLSITHICEKCHGEVLPQMVAVVENMALLTSYNTTSAQCAGIAKVFEGCKNFQDSQHDICDEARKWHAKDGM